MKVEFTFAKINKYVNCECINLSSNEQYIKKKWKEEENSFDFSTILWQIVCSGLQSGIFIFIVILIIFNV